jgi:hypothetical protein
MKQLKRILPDVLAGVGTACIVVALWMVSPVFGLVSAGVALIVIAVLASLFGGGHKP